MADDRREYPRSCLKKPITVVRRSEPDADGKLFDLVCGQGRIEVFLALGETTIPAVVTEASREDQFLMSLVENIARRPPSNRDILREVRNLRERGYSVADIARKIGMERMYVSGIVHLIEHKEVALIEAVETGRLPISIAVQIANGKDSEVSQALSEAYETRQLRGTNWPLPDVSLRNGLRRGRRKAKRKTPGAKSPATWRFRYINSGSGNRRLLSRRRS
jgi:ParB family chromosome partitioning protein